MELSVFPKIMTKPCEAKSKPGVSKIIFKGFYLEIYCTGLAEMSVEGVDLGEYSVIVRCEERSHTGRICAENGDRREPGDLQRLPY